MEVVSPLTHIWRRIKKESRNISQKYERIDLIEEFKRLSGTRQSTLHRRFGQAAKRRVGIGFHILGTLHRDSLLSTYSARSHYLYR